MNRILLAAAFGIMASSGATASEIKVAPATLTLNPTYPQHGYNDLLVHTIAIRTGPGERSNVDTVRLDLLAKGKVVASRIFSGADAVASTDGFRQLPVDGLRNAQVLDPKGLAGWFGSKVELARSANLGPNEALVLTETYFALDATPDQLRVIVSGPRSHPSEATVPVRIYKSPIDYHFPLKGAWLEASLPIMQSHHRFIPPNEFAVDFFKVDANGETVHDGTADPAHWYAYGEPVLAAADGEVVRATGDRVQDRSFLVQRPGETAEQRGNRVGRTMQERAMSDVPASLEGNVVVIRHEVGGTVEYSSYAHLKTGSLKVKTGDHVKQGDQIAEVGDTGDTPVVHLHFQVNAGPDPFLSQSLPFRLSGMGRNGSTQDPGWFVQSQ